MTARSFSGAISCQSFGHLWMYCVCLLGVEYQGRDDMLCNYYTGLSVLHLLKASHELLWRLLCFCLWWFIVFVPMHKQHSTNTASSLFNLQLCHFEPVQMGWRQKGFLECFGFYKEPWSSFEAFFLQCSLLHSVNKAKLWVGQPRLTWK